jgi:hypothetical protein
MATPVTLNSALTLESKLRAWLGLDRLVKDRIASLKLFDAWLSDQPPIEGATVAKLKLPSAGDPIYKRALAVIEEAIERKFYGAYKAYESAGTFTSISEEQFVGYLAHKATAAGPAGSGPRLLTIRTSLLPCGMAALVNKILSTNGICDAGYTNTGPLEQLLRNALAAPGEIFSVKSQYSKAMVTRVPTAAELGLVGEGRDKNNIGAIRSAHCDNGGVLGARPLYTLAPLAGASRANLYYLWIELLTAFDANQTDSLRSSGLWSNLDDKRRAVERIAYVEFTGGRAHEDPPVEKARLVYDYVNNRVYLTVHYDTPNNLEYLTWMGAKPYFLVLNDSAIGTATVTK